MSFTLTPHRRRRLRSADSQTIRKLVDQEAYWSAEALRACLDRVKPICILDTEQGVAAGQACIDLSKRVRDLPPDLDALATSTLGMAHRYAGALDEAIRLHSSALRVPGISAPTAAKIMARRSVVHVLKSEASEALKDINQASRLDPGNPDVESVEAWVCMRLGLYDRSLEINSNLMKSNWTDKWTVTCAAINTAAILRWELLDCSPDLLELLGRCIKNALASIPDSGSGFYAHIRSRALLTQAEALVIHRHGDNHRALNRSSLAAGYLRKQYPDDALFAALDSAYFAALTDQPNIGFLEIAADSFEHSKFKDFIVEQAPRFLHRLVQSKQSASIAQIIELRALFQTQASV